MDDGELRDTLGAVNALPCPFEKFLFSAKGRCRHLRRHFIGEREAAGCTLASARTDCVALLALLQDRARFALRLKRPTGTLPHGKALRLQTGGLLGLQNAVYPDLPRRDRVADVTDLIEEAKGLFGSLEQLPYPEILRSIARTKGRNRGPRA
jgi:hypothetical protein